VSKERFEWDPAKDRAFADPKRVIVEDVAHSTDTERRYYCIGRIARGIVSVRFTYREQIIRIFGAGFWRQDKRKYEKENDLH
jgi:uncharacterized DUF497 family protein